jgi:hypothetical protein
MLRPKPSPGWENRNWAGKIRPKFLGCLDSILLILREIVQDSISRYWQQS